MTERRITPPTEHQRFLLQTLEDRLDRLNKAKADQDPFLVKVAGKGIYETYLDLTRMEIPDSTQPNGFRRVINLDMEKVAKNIIKRYKDGFEKAAVAPQAPIDSSVKPQSLDAEERLAKAARDGVDITNILNQPVQVIMDDTTVRYEIRGKDMEPEKTVPPSPNTISPSTPMQEEYDWGEEDKGWTREVYPKTDLFGHSS